MVQLILVEAVELHLYHVNSKSMQWLNLVCRITEVLDLQCVHASLPYDYDNMFLRFARPFELR